MISALVLGSGAVAEGQQTEPTPTGRWQAGILSVTPVVAIRDVGIDTNLFNDAVDPKSDFTFIASPEAKASWVSGWAVDIRKVRSTLVYFQTYARERSVTPTRTSISRCRSTGCVSAVRPHT